MNVVSIDVGYHNMGIVTAFIDDEYEITVKDVYKINLTCIRHHKVQPHECKIPHTNEVVDLFAHFIQEYGHILENADKILVERQPPTGLTNIEALILYQYRQKTHLISPNAMHSHFMIGHLDYERRKVKTIEIAEKFLESFEKYQSLSRKHDISDAMCMILFDNHYKKEKYRLSKVDRTLPFEKFKYDPVHNNRVR